MSQKLDFSNISLQDTLDLAILAEEESKLRYLELAEQIGSSHSDDAAGFFLYMARNEEKHGRHLTEKRMKLFGKQASTLSQTMRDEMLFVKTPPYDEVRIFMPIRSALDIALESEKRAYNFYDNILNQVKNEEVKKLLIELKNDESYHQNLITDQINQSSDDLTPEVNPDDVDTPEL